MVFKILALVYSRSSGHLTIMTLRRSLPTSSCHYLPDNFVSASTSNTKIEVETQVRVIQKLQLRLCARPD
jgi:hypothetical protein